MTINNNDGGPAFPNHDGCDPEPGLTKREYIATQVMASVIEAVYAGRTKEKWVESEVAVQAVVFADALLAALAEVDK